MQPSRLVKATRKVRGKPLRDNILPHKFEPKNHSNVLQESRSVILLTGGGGLCQGHRDPPGQRPPG